MDAPLQGTRVVSIAVNLPGPAAAARLTTLGAAVTTVLPPGGDPMEQFEPQWYADLHQGQEVLTLDLKSSDDVEGFHALLVTADLLLTSSRPSALRRLGLDFGTLHARHEQLCQVDIVGFPGEAAEVAGHDLTYQAAAGLLQPPAMPASLHVDLAGAERAVAEALAALLQRAATGRGCRREVALSEVAEALAQPARRGLTTPGAVLGGGLAGYSLYQAADGYVALAALEPHFLRRTEEALGVAAGQNAFAEAFRQRSAREWQDWADRHDIPLAAVSEPARTEQGR